MICSNILRSMLDMPLLAMHMVIEFCDCPISIGGPFSPTCFWENPDAPANRKSSLSSTYRMNVSEKKKAYCQRINEVVVWQLRGATVYCKRLASMLSEKWDQHYTGGTTLGWLRGHSWLFQLITEIIQSMYTWCHIHALATLLLVLQLTSSCPNAAGILTLIKLDYYGIMILSPYVCFPFSTAYMFDFCTITN